MHLIGVPEAACDDYSALFSWRFQWGFFFFRVLDLKETKKPDKKTLRQIHFRIFVFTRDSRSHHHGDAD